MSSRWWKASVEVPGPVGGAETGGTAPGRCPGKVTIKKGEKAITDAQVIQIAREAILYVLLLSLPVLGVSLVVGLVISILQATTQVQEQSLTFVPKIIAVFVTLAVLAPWLLKVMVGFTGRLLARLPAVMQ